MEIFPESDDPLRALQAQCLLRLGELLESDARAKDAARQTLLEKMERLVQSESSPEFATQILSLGSEVCADLGLLDEAVLLLQHCRRLASEEHRLIQLRGLVVERKIARGRGHPERARALSDELASRTSAILEDLPDWAKPMTRSSPLFRAGLDDRSQA